VTKIEASRLARRAAIASSTVALILLGLKGWGASSSGSVAMLGSLADTGLDLVASLVTLWGVHVAGLRPDEDHRFGHGKAESLAAMFQVLLIALSAIAIAWRAGAALLAGERAVEAETGILVSLVAGGLTILLLIYQRRVIRATRSIAIQADHVHYQSDLALNGAVIVALALDVFLGLSGADAILAVAIAAWLIWGAFRSATRAIDDLMDREWPDDRRRGLIEFAATLPELKGMHDLRTRSSGSRDFVQFHMFLPPLMSVVEAHDVMERVEQRLNHRFPGVEFLIHPDPEGHVDMAGALPAEIAERPEV
jgi:ferrous-iron efflux pump FieF